MFHRLHLRYYGLLWPIETGSTSNAFLHLMSNRLACANTNVEFIERGISLRFLGLILRFLRLEFSLYNVYITNQFQTTFGLGGSKIC